MKIRDVIKLIKLHALVREGVPPEVFFGLSFDGHIPSGSVVFSTRRSKLMAMDRGQVRIWSASDVAGSYPEKSDHGWLAALPFLQLSPNQLHFRGFDLLTNLEGGSWALDCFVFVV